MSDDTVPDGANSTWSMRRFADELRYLSGAAPGTRHSTKSGNKPHRSRPSRLSAICSPACASNHPAGIWSPTSWRPATAHARERDLKLDPRVADLAEWRKRHGLLVEAMERAAAEEAARLETLLTAFSVLPADQIRRPPFHTLGELTARWDGRPRPAGGVYLPRPDFDDELRGALAASYPFLLVYGDDRAGKSTSAWTAIVEVVDPETNVLVPRDMSTLDELADVSTLLTGPVLIWVDGLTAADLNRLTGAALDRLADVGFIVATISADECAAILDGPRDWMPVARAALRSTYLLHLPYEPEIVEQVALNSSGGVAAAEEAEAGDSADAEMLILRLNTARSSSPAGMALVRAAIDCRRAGLRRPVSDSELRRFFPHYVGEIRNLGVTDELFESGIVWAQGTGSPADDAHRLTAPGARRTAMECGASPRGRRRAEPHDSRCPLGRVDRLRQSRG